MNPKMLLPVVIALHLGAAAWIVDGLGVDEQQSERRDRAWQVVEWNPACVAGHGTGEIARYWSGERRQLDATDVVKRSCVNIH